jgi:hypothetical protein
MDGQARIVWKLARNHTWGTPMPAETLVRVTAIDEDHDEMEQHLEEALALPFVSRGPDGIYSSASFSPTVHRFRTTVSATKTTEATSAATTTTNASGETYQPGVGGRHGGSGYR